MKGLKIILGIILLLCFLRMEAQDARFSQFYAAPLHNNPALSGIFPGQFRIIGNYRNQWSSIIGKSAFNTYAASFDMRFPTTRGDYFAFGLNFLRDDAGDSQFNQTKANLNASFLKQLVGSKYTNTNHFMSLGFQVGIAQNGIDWSKLSFSNQFNDELEEYIPTDPTGENFGLNSLVYVDFNAGLAWYATFDDDKSIYAGFALQHITQPNVAFYDGSSETLFAKFLIQAGGELPLNNNFSVLPALYFAKQGPSYESVPGFNIRYSNHDRNEVALRAGAYLRVVNDQKSAMVTDSFIITSMLEIERMLIGLSYDVNVSSVRKASNSRGAFELSFQYIHPENKRYKMACPKF